MNDRCLIRSHISANGEQSARLHIQVIIDADIIPNEQVASGNVQIGGLIIGDNAAYDHFLRDVHLNPGVDIQVSGEQNPFRVNGQTSAVVRQSVALQRIPNGYGRIIIQMDSPAGPQIAV
ncbi:hypothetical protein D3C73_1249290 [compost metagenome]